MLRPVRARRTTPCPFVLNELVTAFKIGLSPLSRLKKPGGVARDGLGASSRIITLQEKGTVTQLKGVRPGGLGQCQMLATESTWERWVKSMLNLETTTHSCAAQQDCTYSGFAAWNIIVETRADAEQLESIKWLVRQSPPLQCPTWTRLAGTYGRTLRGGLGTVAPPPCCGPVRAVTDNSGRFLCSANQMTGS